MTTRVRIELVRAIVKQLADVGFRSHFRDNHNFCDEHHIEAEMYLAAIESLGYEIIKQDALDELLQKAVLTDIRAGNFEFKPLPVNEPK